MIQKQLAHINFRGGVDAKNDDFLVIPSKLTVAENVLFDDSGTVLRRGAQTLLDTSTTLSTRMYPTGHRDSALIDGGYTSNYPKGISRYTNISAVAITEPSVSTETSRYSIKSSRVGALGLRNIAAGSNYPLYGDNVDIAEGAGNYCLAYEVIQPYAATGTTYGTICVEVRKISDNSILFSTVLGGTVSDSVVRPRVVHSPYVQKFLVFFSEFTHGSNNYNLRLVTVNDVGGTGAMSAPSTLAAVAGTVAVESVDGYEAAFDVSEFSDDSASGMAYAVYRAANITGTLTSFFVNPDGTVAASAAVAHTIQPRPFSAHIEGTRGFVVYARGVDVRGCYRDFGFAGSAEVNILVASGDVVQLTFGYFESELDRELVYTTLETAPTSSKYTVRVQGLTTGLLTLGGYKRFYNSAILSKPKFGRLPTGFVSSSLQDTGYIVEYDWDSASIDMQRSARFACGELAWVASVLYDNPNRRIPSFVPTAGFPFLRWEYEYKNVNGDATGVAVHLLTLDLTSQLNSVQNNGLTVIAGALPLYYDGVKTFEAGVDRSPEYATPSVTNAAGATAAPERSFGPFPDGTVSISLTVGFTDAVGNWHESAPISVGSATFAAPNSYLTFAGLYVPPSEAKLFPVLYRTEAGSTDTTLYQTTSPVRAQNYIAIASGGAFDSNSVLTNEQIYTTSGALPNTPMPACRHISTFQNRLVASGCEDSEQVFVSKTIEKGYGVEWAIDSNSFLLSSKPGHDVVGTCEFADRLFVFTTKGVQVTGGSGPNDAGEGEFAPLVQTQYGSGAAWASPKSILPTKEGVWYHSDDGIRLLAPNGSLAVDESGLPVGSEVDDFVGSKVISLLTSNSRQVWCYTGSVVLVFDLTWKQWSKQTGFEHDDAADWGGDFVTIYSGRIRKYNPTGLTEYNSAGATTNFVSKISTSWLSFAGIQGFQRVSRLSILGRATGTPDIQVLNLKVAHDFDETLVTSVSNALSVTNGTLQYQYHLPKQKCEAVKFTLEWYPQSIGGDGRLRLVDLTLLLGVKPGYYKLPSTKRMG